MAAMCSTHLEGASGMLGLGNLSSWYMVSDKFSFYVHRRAEGFTIATGDVAKNPDANMKKISMTLGDKG